MMIIISGQPVMKQKNGIFTTYLSLHKMVSMILMVLVVLKVSKQLGFSTITLEILQSRAELLYLHTI